MTEKPKFNIGQEVYLKTDPDQMLRLVTAITIRPTGITYALAFDTNDSWHYDFEITTDRDKLKMMSN